MGTEAPPGEARRQLARRRASRGRVVGVVSPTAQTLEHEVVETVYEARLPQDGLALVVLQAAEFGNMPRQGQRLLRHGPASDLDVGRLLVAPIKLCARHATREESEACRADSTQLKYGFWDRRKLCPEEHLRGQDRRGGSCAIFGVSTFEASCREGWSGRADRSEPLRTLNEGRSCTGPGRGES